MAKQKTSNLDFEYLKKLARASAETTLHRLREEIAVIERTFPELSTSTGRSKVAATAKKKAGKWSEASRAAVSERMKKYWAARKKVQAEGAKKKAAPK